MIIMLTCCLLAVAVIAQNENKPTNSGHDRLLSGYYAVKDALVEADAAKAAARADEFIGILKAVDANSLADKEKEAFTKAQARLATGAQAIAGSRKIEEQRTAFAAFSSNMWALISAEGHAGHPAYWQYCPMKKAYWISNTSAIRNPYFGKQMLSCGKTTQTLQ